MFGLPKLAIQAIVAALVLGGGFGVLRCYGGSRYEDGRKRAEAAHTDSVRLRVTAALDSASRVMVPVLEGLTRENDSLRTANAEVVRTAREASARARRAEQALSSVPDSVMAVTPPEVRDLIRNLTESSAALRIEVDKLASSNAALSSQNDSLLVAAASWRKLYGDARAALDTSAKEISQLKRLKDPPRCGFRCGFVTGSLLVAGVVATIIGVAK